MPLYKEIIEDGQFSHSCSSLCYKRGDIYMCTKCKDVITGNMMGQLGKTIKEAENEGYDVVDRECMQPKDFLVSVAKKLEEDDFCVVKNLVSLENARDMYYEIEQLHKVPGKFTPGKLSAGAMNRVGNLEGVRGDSVTWIDGSTEELTLTSKVTKQMNKLALLLYQMNNISMSRISKSKIMVSCYDGNRASYKRHIDSAAAGSLKLTFIFYLNEKFTAKNGGCLRIHKDFGNIDIIPELGKLVIFRSDKVIHEVLPTFTRRFAMTIWYMEVPKRKAQQAAEEMDQDPSTEINTAVKSPKIYVQRKKIKIEDEN